MMKWVRKVAQDLEPLRVKHSVFMPPTAKEVAGHVHVPLFYMLLQVVEYPHPEVAFRFFLGKVFLGLRKTLKQRKKKLSNRENSRTV